MLSVMPSKLNSVGLSTAPRDPAIFRMDLRRTSAAELAKWMTYSRASVCGIQQADGSWGSVATDVPPFDFYAGLPAGLRYEPAGTNYCLNSTNPSTHVTASLATGSYTLWMQGSGSMTVTGGTATYSNGGAATEGAPRTITVTVAGTVGLAKSGTVTAAQLENGSRVTSLITTTSAAASRAGASLTMSLAALAGFDRTNCTLLVSVRPINPLANAGPWFVIDNASDHNDDVLSVNPGTAENADVRIYSGGGAQATFSASSVYPDRVSSRLGLSWRSGYAAMCFNGVTLPAVDVSVTPPASLTRVIFGNGGGYWGGQLAMWLEEFAIYPYAMDQQSLKELTR